MSYTPQVGDRIRLSEWIVDYFDVITVDGDTLFGRHDNGRPAYYRTENNWILLPKRPPLPDLPDKWAAAYRHGVGPAFFPTPEEVLTNTSGMAAVKYRPDPDAITWRPES